MAKKCINDTCLYGGVACVADEECLDYIPAECTKCLWELSCDWKPQKCDFIPDPHGGSTWK